MTNPLTVAANAKGIFRLYRRANVIRQRYGYTPNEMHNALQRFSDILKSYGFGATFPITAVTLQRHANIIEKYLDQNIEFAVHGYTHIDYSLSPLEKQIVHLNRAREVFTKVGINPIGFRSPYLSWNENLYTGLEAAGFSYVSNQTILWDVLNISTINPSDMCSYERALAFYNPLQPSERLSIPQQVNRLIEIPVSLPDDEILIERLGGADGLVENTWIQILTQTYKRGELFTLQLHPERSSLCATGLTAVLDTARGLTPAVWCARLDEIATWWRVRNEAYLHISKVGDDEFKCIVNGPAGTTVLIRAAEVDAHSEPWADGYREVKTDRFVCNSSRRPLIGYSQSTSTDLVKFLRQQGYIVEVSQEPELYSYYINQMKFDTSHEVLILNDIEESSCPLIRFGRWPYGAKSALAITGDIDALTIWDYGLRMIGK